MAMSTAVKENLEPMQRKFYIRPEQLRMAQLHCNEYRSIVNFIRIYSFTGCHYIFNKRTFQCFKYKLVEILISYNVYKKMSKIKKEKGK